MKLVKSIFINFIILKSDYNNNILLVLLLLRQGANINKIGPNGHTALYYAAVSDKEVCF